MTVKIKLIYLICMILCVLITLSTVNATDIDDESISDSTVAEISQSESSITNLNENINEIGIYSEDKDCVDSVNGLSNLDSDDYHSDLNSINSDEKSLKSSLSAINSNENSYVNDLGASESSFADLQQMINNAANGSTINLGGKTFIGNGSTIWITKPITIDGGSVNNKATLNGNFKSNITAITGSNVNIINCNFVNCDYYALSINANNTSIRNCNFEHNGLHLYVGPTSHNFLLDACNLSFGYRNEGTNAYVDAVNSTVRNCNFINNTIFDDTGIMGYGGALQIGTYSNATNIGYVVNCSFINNTVITNNDETHAGALCFRPGIKVSNSTFINNYCNKIGGATTLHADGEIVNCIFINNSAGEYGGAISTGFECDDISVNITNCTFINNSAPMGGAIQIKGNNVKVTNSIFEDNKANESEGGAVFIVGDYALIINSTFVDNFAGTVGAGILINGSDAAVLNSSFDRNIADYGAAVYVVGPNANLFSSNFTNHNVKNGSVYIKGINAYVFDSIFESNDGESGAGLYIEGSNTTLISSNFTLNSANQKGGAIYIDGSNAKLLLSNFMNNDAIPDVLELGTGLGGAIYIKGDSNLIDSSIFNYNTARNGSAIYTDGLNMTLSNTDFDKNQAWSYSLESDVNPAISYFNESDILINFTLIGGNNIANAIYNTASMDQIYFYNVSYISSKGEKTTGKDEIHPVDGAQNSNDGSLLYQDDREDNQLVNVIIYRNLENDEDALSGLSLDDESQLDDSIIDDGSQLDDSIIDDESLLNKDIIFNQTFRTGILGDIAFNLSDYIDEPLEAGEYLIYAKHYEDEYYKGIKEENQFDIIPIVDLAVNIGSSRVNIDFNKTVKYTIKVNNYGPNNATGVNLSAIVPEGLVYLSSIPSIGDYDPQTGVWTIGNLDVGDNQTLIINVQTNKTGMIDYPVNVSSIEDDSNQSNNFNNKTIRVLMADLSIGIEASQDTVNYADKIDWTITVKNNGPNNASKLLISLDPLDEDLIYLNCSNDTFNESSFIWEIPSLLVDDEISFVISTRVNGSNKEFILKGNVSADTFDPIESNNLDSDMVNALPLCDLITKVTVSNSTVNNGDTVDWFVVVSNDGPDDAFDVVVSLSDLESLGLIVLDHDDAFDNDSFEWVIGDLASGENTSISIKTQANKSNDNLTVLADVETSTFELNEENNHDNDSLAINPICDLVITITPDNDPVDVGEIVNWIINVTNNGPDNASDVSVFNNLPEGLEYVVSDSSKGEIETVMDGDGNIADLIWNVGDLENNESAFLVISTQTLDEGTVLSDVNTNSSTLDVNESNNYDSATIDVLPLNGSDGNGTGDGENGTGDNPDGPGVGPDDPNGNLDGNNTGDNENGDNNSDDPNGGSDDPNGNSDTNSDDSNGDSENNSNGSDDNSNDSNDSFEDDFDGNYDGYYDDYPWNDYNFLDDSNENDDSNKNDNHKDKLDNNSLNNNSNSSQVKKGPIDISSKKTGNPLVLAILSIFALFGLGVRKY